MSPTRSPSFRPLFALALVGMLSACGERDDQPIPDPGQQEEPACPTETSGPTFHRGDVAGREIWTAETGPHVIEQQLNVRDGAELIIEPCTEVLVAEDVSINVAHPITPNTGRLVAEGTAERPIRIRGLDGHRWGHLHLIAPGEVRLRHVTFENGGGATAEGATITVYGAGSTPTYRGLFVDHVTIVGSRGAGMHLSRASGFAEGSTQLVIRDSGSETSP